MTIAKKHDDDRVIESRTVTEGQKDRERVIERRTLNDCETEDNESVTIKKGGH